MSKEPISSFLSEGKEPVIERIFQLVERYPSRSAAARAWGINVNTLKNYYRRKDIHPVPRRNQLSKIAEVEGVTMEWLTDGIGPTPTKSPMNQKNQVTIKRHNSLDKLTEILAFLSEEERNRLIETLTRKGVETILYLLDEDNINLLKQRQNRATQATQRATEQPEREYTTQELETMIMTLPVRESLKTAFARGITAGEDADKEILRILESHQQGLSPEGSGNKTTTPAPSLKKKAG
ncbi:hypothetical protein QD153_004601 [Salmonella enterica]|nr:hypothetical protein [Salmonella enterica]